MLQIWMSVTVTLTRGTDGGKHAPWSAALNTDLTWPGVQYVVRRACERRLLRTGPVRQAVRSALPHLPAPTAPAARWAHGWRGQWTIENQVQYVRAVTFGEDAHQMHTGHAPQVLAALRNALCTLLRAAGWTTRAAAWRPYSSSVPTALQVISLPIPGR